MKLRIKFEELRILGFQSESFVEEEKQDTVKKDICDGSRDSIYL